MFALTCPCRRRNQNLIRTLLQTKFCVCVWVCVSGCVHVRGFGRMDLATRHRHTRDDNIDFFKDSHSYRITRGEKSEFAPVSVTSFCKHYFTQFDARVCVDTYFLKWKSNPASKYHALIHNALRFGSSEEDAKQLIMGHWVALGQKASEEGTYMHERAEHLCNGLQASADDKEMSLLSTWQENFEPHMEWRPYRTEWMLWWEEKKLQDKILVAGTLDLLLRSEKTGDFALVDFKRTNPAPKSRGGAPNLLGPASQNFRHPGYASTPLVEVEDSKYGAYSMQLNILSKMLRERYEIDVGDNMYLLQIHEDLDEAHCVRVPCYRAATNMLFAVETERQLTSGGHS